MLRALTVDVDAWQMNTFLEWQFIIRIDIIFLLIFKGQSVNKRICLTLPDVPLLLSSCSSFSHFLVIVWRVIVTSWLFDKLTGALCAKTDLCPAANRGSTITRLFCPSAMVLILIWNICNNLSIEHHSHRIWSFNFELCEFHVRCMQYINKIKQQKDHSRSTASIVAYTWD